MCKIKCTFWTDQMLLLSAPYGSMAKSPQSAYYISNDYWVLIHMNKLLEIYRKNNVYGCNIVKKITFVHLCLSSWIKKIGTESWFTSLEMYWNVKSGDLNGHRHLLTSIEKPLSCLYKCCIKNDGFWWQTKNKSCFKVITFQRSIEVQNQTSCSL